MLFEKVHKTIKIEIDETKNKLNKTMNIFFKNLVILIPLYRGIC